MFEKNSGLSLLVCASMLMFAGVAEAQLSFNLPKVNGIDFYVEPATKWIGATPGYEFNDAYGVGMEAVFAVGTIGRWANATCKDPKAKDAELTKNCTSLNLEVNLGYSQTMPFRDHLFKVNEQPAYGIIRSMPSIATYAIVDYGDDNPWGWYGGLSLSLEKITGTLKSTEPNSTDVGFSSDTLAYAGHLGLTYAISDVISPFVEVSYRRSQYPYSEYKPAAPDFVSPTFYKEGVSLAVGVSIYFPDAPKAGPDVQVNCSSCKDVAAPSVTGVPQVAPPSVPSPPAVGPSQSPSPAAAPQGPQTPPGA